MLTGTTWSFVSDKKLVLRQKDKKHPTIAGIYLAACVFYATIYGKSPEGLPGGIDNMTDEEVCCPLHEAKRWAAQVRQALVTTPSLICTNAVCSTSLALDPPKIRKTAPLDSLRTL
jgi:hypothetical protein